MRKQIFRLFEWMGNCPRMSKITFFLKSTQFCPDVAIFVYFPMDILLTTGSFFCQGPPWCFCEFFPFLLKFWLEISTSTVFKLFCLFLYAGWVDQQTVGPLDHTQGVQSNSFFQPLEVVNRPQGLWQIHYVNLFEATWSNNSSSSNIIALLTIDLSPKIAIFQSLPPLPNHFQIPKVIFYKQTAWHFFAALDVQYNFDGCVFSVQWVLFLCPMDVCFVSTGCGFLCGDSTLEAAGRSSQPAAISILGELWLVTTSEFVYRVVNKCIRVVNKWPAH